MYRAQCGLRFAREAQKLLQDSGESADLDPVIDQCPFLGPSVYSQPLIQSQSSPRPVSDVPSQEYLEVHENGESFSM